MQILRHSHYQPFRDCLDFYQSRVHYQVTSRTSNTTQDVYSVLALHRCLRRGDPEAEEGEG